MFILTINRQLLLNDIALHIFEPLSASRNNSIGCKVEPIHSDIRFNFVIFLLLGTSDELLLSMDAARSLVANNVHAVGHNIASISREYHEIKPIKINHDEPLNPGNSK